MKTLMYLFVVAILVIAGCAQDETLFETPDNLELKKAKVPIPMKADLFAVPDMESDPILISGLDPNNPDNYLLTRMIISGTGSHVGRVNAKKSFYEFKSIEFILENGLPFTNQTGIGLMVGANGDSFEFTWWVKQSLLNGDYIGGMEITPGSGTGKFKDSSGSGDIVGGWNQDRTGVLFKIDGYLIYK
jgi:hypothetical protein